MKPFIYCPLCKTELTRNERGQQICLSCRYKNYDSPVPAVTGLVIYEGKVVLVQRNTPPFVGEWCMPCGYINANEDPAQALIREVREETGLLIRPTQVVMVANPAAMGIGDNQIVIHYLTEVIGGELRAGDDAKNVGLFNTVNMPKICFQTHERVIQRHFVLYDSWIATNTHQW